MIRWSLDDSFVHATRIVRSGACAGMDISAGNLMVAQGSGGAFDLAADGGTVAVVGGGIAVYADGDEGSPCLFRHDPGGEGAAEFGEIVTGDGVIGGRVERALLRRSTAGEFLVLDRHVPGVASGTVRPAVGAMHDNLRAWNLSRVHIGQRQVERGQNFVDSIGERPVPLELVGPGHDGRSECPQDHIRRCPVTCLESANVVDPHVTASRADGGDDGGEVGLSVDITADATGKGVEDWGAWAHTNSCAQHPLPPDLPLPRPSAQNVGR